MGNVDEQEEVVVCVHLHHHHVPGGRGAGYLVTIWMIVCGEEGVRGFSAITQRLAGGIMHVTPLCMQL